MACIFRWAHFSDIHFQINNAGFNTVELRNALPAFLKGIKDTFDTLILTGDFRYAPSQESNPQKVVDYIFELANSLNIDKSQIVSVPGNHDLNRNRARKYFIEGLNRDYKPDIGTVDNEVMDKLISDFSYYFEMHNLLEDKTVWEKDNPHCIVEFEKCNLLLLNTALTAGNSNPDRDLLIGSSYIQAVLSKVNKFKPIIAVGHHSFDYLRNDECKYRCGGAACPEL